jgi:transposase
MKNPTYYIGLDVHKKMTQACVIDDTGDVLLEKRFPTDRVGVDYLVKHLPEGGWKTALEASSCAYPLLDLLREREINVSMTHPMATKWITASMKKTDQQDAYKLAELLRLGALPQAYAPQKEVRALRYLTRERIWLSRERTKFTNQIRWRMHATGISIGHKVSSKRGVKELEQAPEGYLRRQAALVNTINHSIKEVNQEIHRRFESNPQAQILATRKGVGEYSAVAIMAEIADINRFPHPKKLCAYAGLVPTVRQSGENTYLGGTRKQCNKNLKWIMIQCAHTAIQYDPQTREQYQKLEPRIGNKKAVVAVARKMLTIMYWMLKNQQTDARNVTSR